MTKIEKEKIADQIMNLLIQLTNDDMVATEPAEKPVEMLTVKECCKEVKGLSENTVRTGEGKQGRY